MELMDYLKEIEELKTKHNLNSEICLVLTILAICKINNIDYDKFKEFAINNLQKQNEPNKNI